MMPNNIKLLQEDEATPLELAQFMSNKYGQEWIQWEPETLIQTLSLDSINENLYNKNKLQAIQVILSNIDFWKQWNIFEKIVLSFNNIPPRFDIMEEVSPAQMAYAIRVAYKIRRDPNIKLPRKAPTFSPEVKLYIAARAYTDGTVYMPKPLDVAQSELNQMTGMQKLAKEILDASNDPNLQIDETPISIGAIKALIVKAYAFSDKRKPIV